MIENSLNLVKIHQRLGKPDVPHTNDGKLGLFSCQYSLTSNTVVTTMQL